MNQVKIVTEIKGKLRKATVDVPEKWDEVQPHLFPTLAQIYLSPEDKMNDYDKAYRAFMLFATETREGLKLAKELTAEELYDILPKVAWVIDQMDLQKNLVPKLHYKKTFYLGPDNSLNNMRFAEWVLADTYYCDYAETKDEKALNNLVATIYRPAGSGHEYKPGNVKYRGDKREKFNDALVADRADLLGNIPFHIKEAIYLWFASCRWQLKTYYKEVFEGDGSKQNDILAGYGWFGIYDDLRGDPKFGGPAMLEDEFIHTIFQSLVRSHYKYLELKREYS